MCQCLVSTSSLVLLGSHSNKELDYFTNVFEDLNRPFTVILGGVHPFHKISKIHGMLDYVDDVIITGGTAFTFNKVLNDMSIGASLFDEESAKLVEGIMQKAEHKGVNIHIPSDFICADKFESDAQVEYRTESQGIR